jgi:hypothetical protein
VTRTLGEDGQVVETTALVESMLKCYDETAADGFKLIKAHKYSAATAPGKMVYKCAHSMCNKDNKGCIIDPGNLGKPCNQCGFAISLNTVNFIQKHKLYNKSAAVAWPVCKTCYNVTLVAFTGARKPAFLNHLVFRCSCDRAVQSKRKNGDDGSSKASAQFIDVAEGKLYSLCFDLPALAKLCPASASTAEVDEAVESATKKLKFYLPTDDE